MKNLPELPYYAVIFTSQRSDIDDNYDEMARLMDELSQKQDGYLGIESYRNEDGKGVTISYWKSEDDIRNWKKVVDHLAAQKLGREKWYSYYSTRVAKVERHYGYESP